MANLSPLGHPPMATEKGSLTNPTNRFNQYMPSIPTRQSRRKESGDDWTRRRSAAKSNFLI